MTDKIDKLVADYIRIRDAKERRAKEHKAELAKFTTTMAKIENLILEQMSQLGTESMRTSQGTCYKSTRTSATVDDRDTFLAFAVEHPQFLESRANKTAVEEYLEAHGELPPGVRVTRAVQVNIRRS